MEFQIDVVTCPHPSPTKLKRKAKTRLADTAIRFPVWKMELRCIVAGVLRDEIEFAEAGVAFEKERRVAIFIVLVL
jgi:hypothetical protein